MGRLSDWRGALAGLTVGGYVMGNLAFVFLGLITPSEFRESMAWVVGPVITFYFVHRITETAKEEVRTALERVERRTHRHKEAAR